VQGNSQLEGEVSWWVLSYCSPGKWINANLLIWLMSLQCDLCFSVLCTLPGADLGMVKGGGGGAHSVGIYVHGEIRWGACRCR